MRATKCASCREFPLDQSGQAQCSIFENQESWDNSACVLYTRANNINERRQIVTMLAKKQEG